MVSKIMWYVMFGVMYAGMILGILIAVTADLKQHWALVVIMLAISGGLFKCLVEGIIDNVSEDCK